MPTPLEIAVKYVDLMNAGDFDSALSMLADDGPRIVMPAGDSFDRKTFRHLIDAAMDRMPGGNILTITNAIVDGERVALEATGAASLTNGGVYTNRYVFVIETEGDKIMSFREYFDTVKAAETFGRKAMSAD